MQNNELSEDGIKMLEAFEGTFLSPYKDKTGHWTIGVGHLITSSIPGLVFSNNKWSGKISQETCDSLFLQDVLRFENHVNTYLGLKITQKQFDSIVSLEFNKGYGAGLEVIKLVNNNQIIAAACKFLEHNKSGFTVIEGLTKRRILESANFLGATLDFTKV